MIGCILPLSGKNAAYGNKALDAVLLAAGVFNGAKETPIRVVIEDSQSDPAVAGGAVEKLARAGAISIIGPLGSLEAVEAAREAQRLCVPILTLTQREGITDIGDQVFRNFLTAPMQIRAIVQYAQADIGLRRFAILYPDDPYGKEMARLFRDEVLRKGGEIRNEQSYKTDQTDFREEIRLLTGKQPEGSEPELPPGIKPEVSEPGLPPGIQPEVSEPELPLGKQPEGSALGLPLGIQPKPTPGFEALFIPDYSSRIAMIVPQLVYYDVTGIRLLGTSGWDSPELLKTNPEHLQGAIFVDGFFANSFRPEVNAFGEAFYMAYGREPGVLEALVYDAAEMTVRLLVDNPGGTRDDFRKNLLQLKGYPGVTGRTSFSAARDAEKDLFVLTVRDGQIIQVK